jgi:hypothetical protein
MPQYGYQAPRMAFDSTIQIPTFCGVPTLKSVQFVNKKGAIAFDSCNNRFYTYNPKTLSWSQVSGGGSSTDTTSLSNRINLKIDSIKRRRDSVFGYRNGSEVFQFKDSVGSGSSGTIDQVLASGDTAKNKNFTMQNTSGTYGIAMNSNNSSTSSLTLFSNNFDNQIALYSDDANDRPYIYFQDAPFATTLYGGMSSGQVFMPLTNSGIDTLATLFNLRNSKIDTTSLSNRINNKIDSLKRRTDSVFAYRNGNQIFQYKDSVGTNPPPNGYYGAFQDNTTQTALDINVATSVKFNTTDLSNGVTIVNDGSGNPTRVTIANAGVYNIQFSLQLEKISGSGNYVIDIWLRKNGTNVEGTTGKVVLTGSANASPVVAAWNYVLQLASNDYVQLMWSTSNTNAVIFSESASSPYPSLPSSILTITQQSGIMAGTGISPIDTANMLSPYQRKFLAANSFMANNTASAANANATTFKQFGNATYNDSITITGASNPSGAINHTFRWSQIGNLVILHITLTYASNGSLSQVAMELPDGLPIPILPTGLTANNDIICYGTGFMVSTTTGVSTVFSKVFLRQNTGLTNDYEIVINQATNSSYRIMNATIQYLAQ